MVRVVIILLLLVVPAGLWLWNDTGERPPNVVLITIESLRTDHVGFMDGVRETTPALDALARESVVYEDAHSVTSWTLTSHASLFTGLYPAAHGTIRPLDRLDDSYATLAERLAEAGYQTAGVVSGPYLRRAHNLQQGFEIWVDELSSDDDAAAHDDVTNPAMLATMRRFLTAERDPRRPFLLFGYFWDPHYDFIPPPPYDTRFVEAGQQRIDVRGFGTSDRIDERTPAAALDYVRAQYDGEILWTDDTLGRLFETLRELDLWDDTLIVVTADHGEEFFDHGYKGHKRNLFAETVHVPLIVKYPRGKPVGRDRRLASLVDLLPTLLEAAGLTAGPELDGRSLLDPHPDPRRAVFYELLSIWYHRQDDGSVLAREQEWIGVRRGVHKLVGVAGARMFLFDVGRDPAERDDLLRDAGQWGPLAEELGGLLTSYRARMQDKRARFGRGGPAEIDPAQLESLRALGYVQ